MKKKNQGWCVYQVSSSGKLGIIHWTCCPPMNWRHSGNFLSCVSFYIRKTIFPRIKR